MKLCLVAWLCCVIRETRVVISRHCLTIIRGWLALTRSLLWATALRARMLPGTTSNYFNDETQTIVYSFTKELASLWKARHNKQIYLNPIIGSYNPSPVMQKTFPLPPSPPLFVSFVVSFSWRYHCVVVFPPLPLFNQHLFTERVGSGGKHFLRINKKANCAYLMMFSHPRTEALFFPSFAFLQNINFPSLALSSRAKETKIFSER